MLNKERLDEAVSSGGDILKAWGTNVETARIALGWKREQLAVLAEVHPTTVFKIEAGTVRPSVSVMIRIAAALDVRPEDLFEFPSNETLSGSYAVAS